MPKSTTDGGPNMPMGRSFSCIFVRLHSWQLSETFSHHENCLPRGFMYLNCLRHVSPPDSFSMHKFFAPVSGFLLMLDTNFSMLNGHPIIYVVPLIGNTRSSLLNMQCSE